MLKIFATVFCAGILLLPAYADNLSLSGSTSGQFSNPTGGSTASGNKWYYSNTSDYVSFDGVTLFTGQTPSSFEFGRITLTNYANGPDATFTADLNVIVNFTDPLGQMVTFSDGLQIIAKPGGGQSGHGDGIDLAFHGFPGPQTFTVGKDVYTVSYDGFYNSATTNSVPVSSLFVANNPGGSAAAYLWGSVSAERLQTESLRAPLSAVPEPGSILLFATAAGGAFVSFRRKRQA